MNVKTVKYGSPTAAQDFAASLRETGFAVLSGHPIPVELIHGTFAEWREFFASDEKHRFTFDPKVQAGYFPFKSENAKGYSLKDLKEFFHYYPARGNLPSVSRQNTPELFQKLSTLAAELLGWLDEATPAEVRSGFSIPLGQMIQNSEETLMRSLHYPPFTGDEEAGAVRAAAHEDINLITLLPAATEPGLQVRDVRGNWHEVTCDPGTIVINSGDMLKLASRDYYPSTTHRVVNPAGSQAKSSRYSMPLFLHPRWDVKLSERYSAREYLHERLREIGLLPKN